MDLGISSRVALVTGASSGIGRAIALQLAREGVTLAIAARRKDELARVAEEAQGAGATQARGFETDLNDPGSVDRLLHDVRAAFGPVDILVANSGGPKPGTFSQAGLEDWDAGYRAVLRNMVQLVHGVLPGMRDRRWGRIVALTSSSVKQPIPTLVLSNAFRTALVSSLKTLSLEVAKDGITVNSIATGRVLTDRLRSLYEDEAKMNQAAREDVPIQRVAQPEEFAPLVTFLCGEPARYVTGQTIAIDGGLIKSLF